MYEKRENIKEREKKNKETMKWMLEEKKGEMKHEEKVGDEKRNELKKKEMKE